MQRGGFGEVWKCRMGETPVAVKKLLSHWLELDSTAEHEFEKEIDILKKIRHPNIVLFFGAGKESIFEITTAKPFLQGTLEDNTPFLITEYVSKGSLMHVLQSSDRFSIKQKLSFCVDSANGMKFLHSLSPPYIHRDVKPQNLLVTSQLRVKIADFGTAKLLGVMPLDSRSAPFVPSSFIFRSLLSPQTRLHPG